MRNFDNHAPAEQAVKHTKVDSLGNGNNSHFLADGTSQAKDVPRIQQKYFEEVERKLANDPRTRDTLNGFHIVTADGKVPHEPQEAGTTEKSFNRHGAKLDSPLNANNRADRSIDGKAELSPEERQAQYREIRTKLQDANLTTEEWSTANRKIRELARMDEQGVPQGDLGKVSKALDAALKDPNRATALDKLGNALTETARPFLDSAKDLSSLGTEIKEASVSVGQKAYSGIRSLASDTAASAHSAWNTTRSAVSDLSTATKQKAGEFIEHPIDTTVSLAGKTAGAVRDGYNSVKETVAIGVDAAVDTVNNVRRGFNIVKEEVPQMMDTVKKDVAETVHDLYDPKRQEHAFERLKNGVQLLPGVKDIVEASDRAPGSPVLPSFTKAALGAGNTIMSVQAPVFGALQTSENVAESVGAKGTARVLSAVDSAVGAVVLAHDIKNGADILKSKFAGKEVATVASAEASALKGSTKIGDLPTDSMAVVKPKTDVSVNGHRLENGSSVTLGREDLTRNFQSVDGKHLHIVHNSDGALLIRDSSTHGTYVKAAGSDSFRRIQSEHPVRINPNDQIRLGGPKGPELKITANAEGAVSVNGQKLEKGKIAALGREDVVGNLDAVSGKHLDMLHNRQGDLLIRDRSTNGTYVKSAGSDSFERIPANRLTKIGAYDQVRLGSPAGHELQLDISLKHSRIWEHGGKSYELPGNGYYFGKVPHGEIAPVKLRVATDSPSDFGRLQNALIPALHKDAELSRLAKGWKVVKPELASTAEGSRVLTGKGQDAKAFTFEVDSHEDAVKLHKKLDDLLARNNLSRDKPIETGNLDIVSGSSQRVGTVRDTWAMAETRTVNGHSSPGFALDEPLAQKLASEFKLKPGQELNSDQLRRIEEKAGITFGTLNYSKDGKLMLLKRCDGSGRYGKGMYAAEAIDDRQKQLVKQSDREALYRLHTRYGLDPVEMTARR